MKKLSAFLICLLLIGCGSKNKEDNKQSKEVKTIENIAMEKNGDYDPIANPDAVKGGTYTTWGSSFPKSLNMWLDYNSFSKAVTDLQFEGLVNLHTKENEPVGILAQSWTISDDKKTFTFKIHDQAKWSDGKSITAEDIQFYYDVMMNTKNLTSLFRVSLKRLNRPEVIDEKTIRLTAKENHWSNFWTAAGMTALPKHIWNDVNFNKQNFDFPVISGPYKLKEVKKNRYIILERRNDWWGLVKKYNQYKFNFKNIKYKSMEDKTKALEATKRGSFHAYAVHTYTTWMKPTDFDDVKKGWVIKQRVFNNEPKGFQGLAINLRKEKFQDVRVRKALCHLFNRELINEKLMFNQYYLLNSFYPDLYPNNMNPDVPLLAFNPDKARALLKEAGWLVDSDGVIRKDGKAFEIIFSSRSVDHRHLNIYLEDLKKVGIKASIEQLSLSTYRKRMDNHNFDITWLAWSSVRLRDPEHEWHSSTADQISTNNITGVKDPIIDSLIEAQKTEMSLDKRNEILKQIDRRLYDIIPYALMWHPFYSRLLYWNKFGTPKYVLDKYNSDDIIPTYWWFDPVKAKRLQDAMNNNKNLPQVISDVYYKE